MSDKSPESKGSARERAPMMSIGIAIGLSIGVAIGVATDNIGLWLPLGMLFGLAAGLLYDRTRAENEKEPPGE